MGVGAGRETRLPRQVRNSTGTQSWRRHHVPWEYRGGTHVTWPAQGRSREALDAKLMHSYFISKAMGRLFMEMCAAGHTHILF